MIQQQTNKEIEDTKNVFNNLKDDVKDTWDELDNKHIILGRGNSASATGFGVKNAITISKQYDTKTGETDIMVTGDVGGGTGLSATPMSGSLQLTIADNGMSDMYGSSDTGGFTFGPISVDVSTSAHALTYSFNFGGEGAEVHKTASYTYSKKQVGDQFSDFKEGYKEHIEEKITGQTDQETNQMTEKEKREKELKDAYYNKIDDMLGVDDK